MDRALPLSTLTEDAAAREQAVDSYTLTRAKELLCELWKQGRITADVRFTAESVLSAALYAVENPEARNITQHQGAQMSAAQWLRGQRRINEPF